MATYGALVLEAADGNRFEAYQAHPVRPSTRAMVILPDVRGLHAYYRDLAVRFAEAGFHCVALDYFGRTAGVGQRGEAFEFWPHIEQTTPEGVAADTAAAVAHVRSAAPARWPTGSRRRFCSCSPAPTRASTRSTSTTC